MEFLAVVIPSPLELAEIVATKLGRTPKHCYCFSGLRWAGLGKLWAVGLGANFGHRSVELLI